MLRIFSFILVSVGVSKPSLMAAYSSTSFGIIFVSIFKIINLRPLKRKLVLLVESSTPEAPAQAPAPVHTHPLAAPLLAAQNPRGDQKTVDSVMQATYPRATDYAADDEADSEVSWMQQFILAVRQIRGEMDIAPSRKIPLLLQNAAARERALVDKHLSYLTRLAGLESVKVLEPADAAPEAATAILGDLTLLVPMAGLIDPKAEIERLSKRIAKNDSDLGKLKAKLGNENFVRNAPPEVVAADRARMAELEAQNGSLRQQLDKVHRLGGS